MHIETELADNRNRAKVLAAKVAQREAFIDTLKDDYNEAKKLHADSLASEQKALADLQAIISQQEKDIAAMKEKEAAKPDLEKKK